MPYRSCRHSITAAPVSRNADARLWTALRRRAGSAAAFVLKCGTPRLRSGGLPGRLAARTLLACLALGLAAARPALAQPDAAYWQTVISGHPASPPYLLVVDKSRQQLSFFERRSPLRLSRMFFCTTGQAVGAKEVEGDLKTPEGVYFVVQRIGSGLDYIKYGNEAYTLNYPNPVDRLRRKTGYGIWIHGRGEPLVPLQTEGCVSMDNSDLAMIGRLLEPGTPVALTETFAFTPEENSEQAAVADLLRQKVKDWAAAWSSRSRDYFAFYDKDAYSLAQGEPFSAFQAQKERLFGHLPWIRTTVDDIQALQGPGYWVTWFYQDYRAPNLSTRGVRRLYWGKDGGGEFRILGMEWLPGMRTSALLASAGSLLPSLEAAPSAVSPPGWATEQEEAAGSYGVIAAAEGRLPPRPVRPPSPETAPPGAGLLADASGGEPVPSDAAPATETPPITTSARDADAILLTSGAAEIPPAVSRQGGDDSGNAQRRADGPASGPDSAASAQGGTADHVEHPLGMAKPSQEAVRLAREERLRGGRVPDLQAARNAAPEKSAPPPVKEPADPPRRPAPDRNDRAAPPADSGDAKAAEAQAGREPGPKTPEDAPPAAPGDDGASAVAAAVEAWRLAWETGSLDGYMAHYAAGARQGARASAEGIRRQKEQLWKRARPRTVALEDVRVTVKGETARVTMRQIYTDEKGNGDIGRKTLAFIRKNGAWLITQEDWSALPNETGN